MSNKHWDDEITADDVPAKVRYNNHYVAGWLAGYRAAVKAHNDENAAKLIARKELQEKIAKDLSTIPDGYNDFFN